MKYLYLSLIAPIILSAADPYAEQLFQKNCASCHQAASGAEARIPQIAALKTMSPAAILRTLESGIMKSQAAPLSGDERMKVANFLGTAVTVERRREEIANPCPAGGPASAPWKDGPGQTQGWTSWGGGLANTRFLPANEAGLQADAVPRLALKWAFAFPDTSTLRSQPAVYRGRVFVGSQDGSVCALDAVSGCVHWSTMVQAQVRSGIATGEIAGNPAIFFGDSAGYVYALDGATGKQLWRMRPDEHPASTVTATPVFHQGRLYVGAASREEALSVSAGYMCCTFRGSEAALDAATGKTIWKRYMIPELAKERSKSKHGAAVFGPSGAGVWTAPTLDPERDTMYVTTGDNYSDPATSMSDAVVALRLSSGEILWSKQLTAKDAWNSSCQLPGKVNCPDTEGPDFDFAASAILVSLPPNEKGPKRALLLGQKSAVIYAVDPDRKGQTLWQARIGEGGTVGGIEWGPASDGRNVYVALSDIRFEVALKSGSNDRTYQLDPNKGGGLFAFRVDNGERMWQTPPPGCGDRRPCSPAQSAAITAIPGAVFSGSEDGHLRGYSTTNGHIIWDFDTAREFKTVNGVAGHGGAIDVAGPVVAGGMLFSVSGYPARGGMGGNVLLAFGVE
ncbi:MAG: pvaA [Bryobacterales bacterium]|nr:pvaA [Bryobacterales bacterium]